MGLTSLRGSQENELDEEGEVREGVGGAQLGQLPGHEEAAGGLALVHLPRTVTEVFQNPEIAIELLVLPYRYTYMYIHVCVIYCACIDNGL